jgi:hypothetical protein
MSDPVTREDLIGVLESMVSGQLRALRLLRSGRPGGHRERAPARKRSNTSIVQDILIAAGTPLHINEIILRAKRDHGATLNRESIVSALTKKVLDKRVFCRTGRNEFGLLAAGRR